MAGQMDIDARNFQRMIRELERKTSATFSDVIRDSAGKVLAGTASKTRVSTEEDAKEKVKRLFRKPLRLSTGDKVGVTSKGRVWFQRSGWDRKNWVLVARDGTIKPPPSEVFRTSRGGKQFKYKLPSKLRAEITQAMKAASNIRERELSYAKSVVGMGRASWVFLMKQLKLKIPSTKKIAEVSAVKIPDAARRTLYAREVGVGEKYMIVIKTKVQAALNKKARGFSAFRQSINQQGKTFQKNLEKDLEKYVRRFAKRNGFTVK